LHRTPGRFLQLADGIDDSTWMHHLQRGDYSHWFREIINDDDLAQIVAKVEQDKHTSARESRRKVKEAIESRYTHVQVLCPQVEFDSGPRK